jgi:hypothetical protein
MFKLGRGGKSSLSEGDLMGDLERLYSVLHGMNGSDVVIRLHQNGGDDQRVFLSLVETVYTAAQANAQTFTWPPETEHPPTR